MKTAGKTAVFLYAVRYNFKLLCQSYRQVLIIDRLCQIHILELGVVKLIK